MPAQSDSLKLKIIKQYLDDSRETLISSHPVVDQWLETTGLSVSDLRKTADSTPNYKNTPNFIDSEISDELSGAKDAELLHTITLEEHEAIIYKLREVAKLNPGTLEKNDLLYLEQQLSDIFGFELSSQLEGNELPFTLGIMAASPHQKRYPKDDLSQHPHYPEAGISSSRSSYGWMLENGKFSDTAALREQFGISLPLAYLPNWQKDHQDLAKWYKYRKLLIINPFDLKAVVGNVIDGGMISTLKYQFSGSPEIIRAGFIWSSKARGRVLVFYINDDSDSVELGPISITS